MQSKITLLGMYNFDNHLFDKLTFPDGIDRELAINRILNKSEEFELIYSDFDYLQDRIGIWGEIWSRTFAKWVEALNIEYDPLYNYDRHELYTDTNNRIYEDKHANVKSDNSNKTFEDSHIASRADSTTEDSESFSNTVTASDTDSDTNKQVSAYDETDYSDRELETSNAVSNQTGSGSATGNVSGTSNSNEVSGNTGAESINNNSVENANSGGTSNEITQHEAHLYGNIGVTTSQQMLKDQLDVVTWNLYEHISDIFIDEFCILVY